MIWTNMLHFIFMSHFASFWGYDYECMTEDGVDARGKMTSNFLSLWAPLLPCETQIPVSVDEF